MIKHNLVLTDLMHLGDHIYFENYWRFSALPNEQFDCFANYYELYTFDLKKYDRKIVLIDHRDSHHKIWKNKEYIHDIQQKIEKLHKLGFVFIIAHPWESDKNISIDMYSNILKDKSVIRWNGGVNFFWYMMYQKHKDQNFQFDHLDKKYDFLYLNKLARSHRKKLFDALTEQHLIENSLISFIDRGIRLPPEYELPWVNRKNYPYRGMDQDLYEKPYNDTVCSIVSETNVGDGIFLTEKIWKSIIAGHLFVVHGNTYYLKRLRELGFKTFSTIFDESYDDEIDEDKKIKKIIETIKTIKVMNPTELYQHTKEIRDHNQQVFFDESKVKGVVNDSILRLLKFFDSSQISS